VASRTQEVVRGIKMRRSLIRFTVITALGVSQQFWTSPALADGPAGESTALDNLICEARRANPDLQAAKVRYLEALGNAPQENSLPDPRFMMQYMILPSETRAGPQRYRFELEQEIPVWGLRQLRESAAQHEAESVHANASSFGFDLINETRSNFFDWHYFEQALKINRTNRDLMTALQKVAEELYRTGQVPQSDPLKARVELARINVSEAAFLRMREVAVSRLRALLGRNGAEPLGWPVLPDGPDSLIPLAALQEMSLRQRPELKGAEERILAATIRRKIAEKSYWPDLVLGVMFAPTKGGTNPGFAEDGMDDLAIKAGINIPLQIERRRASIEQAGASMAAAGYELDGIRNRIRLEVQEAYQRLSETTAVRALYKNEIIPAAELELQAARQAYTNTRISFVSLLDSERSYIAVLLEEADAARSHWQAAAALERAIGNEPKNSCPSDAANSGDRSAKGASR